jgi:photosystem II stability/assembly factor-like uncharacterized protein
MLAADGATLGSLYRSQDAGLSWQRVRPAGSLRSVVVDQFAFASDGRVLALVRIGGRRAAFLSKDGGESWDTAPLLEIGSRSPPVHASPLAASGTSFLLGTNQRGFWRLAPDATRWTAA